jgi:hypothetical protein
MRPPLTARAESVPLGPEGGLRAVAHTEASVQSFTRTTGSLTTRARMT